MVSKSTIELNPYLAMLKIIVRIYKRYLPFNETSKKLANFINELDENRWAKLADNISKENIGRYIDD